MSRNSPFAIFFTISLLGFSLHFTWEYFQCLPFFKHIQTSPTLGAMILASFGDLIIMGIVYLVVALTQQTWSWITSKWKFSVFVTIITTSLFLAMLVELVALKSNRWAYTETNPLLPILDISIVPLLQMVVINPISFYSTKFIINRLRRIKQNTKERL